MKQELNKSLLDTTYSGFDLKKIKELVELGANVNTKNQRKITPLMFACMYSELEVVEYLISKGAKISAKDAGGWTPLMYASYRHNTNTVKFLLNFTETIYILDVRKTIEGIFLDYDYFLTAIGEFVA